MDKVNFAKYLDLANHHQSATLEEIKSLCERVLEYGFNSAFVNPCFVLEARNFLGDGGKVGTVASFPLGQDTIETKINSARQSVSLGADELDVSLNIGYLKEHAYEKSLEEMKRIIEKVKGLKKEALVKYIIETGCLTDEEILKASELVLLSGADFIKTCSGFGPRGATLRDVELIKSVVDEKIKIKVAGGIDSYQEVMNFINIGVSRIGTSKAVEIIEEANRVDLNDEL